MADVETDYLVVGAGASGLAFVDTVLSHSDADVVLVDRRHRPGGHWNDAYPFVRLHQPSAYYGVPSLVLGSERIDDQGPNSGWYERATGDEIRAYYQTVLEERLLASGRVRFLPGHDYRPAGNEHVARSRLTGQTTTIRVRRRIVDATYLESSVPATHQRSFGADEGVRLVTPTELVRVEGASGYTVIGAGKTAMDTCAWLLDNGVAPEDICWVRPRDPWTVDRDAMQPLTLLPRFVEAMSLQLEAAAQASDTRDLFERLESSGQLHRLDPDVEPTIYWGAILSAAERASLRRIDNAVRQGHVRHISRDRMATEHGSVRTDAARVHVDCTARGVNAAPARPVFAPGRITIESLQSGVIPFSAALIGFIEASERTDAEKNYLCPPLQFSGEATDWISQTYVTQLGIARRREEQDIRAWLRSCRLNVMRGAGEHRGDPVMQSAMLRIAGSLEPALTNLRRLGSATVPEPRDASPSRVR